MRRSGNYTPYKTAPPKSRVVNGTRSRSPARYSKVKKSKGRSRSSKTTVKKVTKKRRLRAMKKIEAIEMIDYGDAYRTPDSYYVRDSRYGRVYGCPPPKHNLLHVNEDPTLGGTCFKSPSPAGELSLFNSSCKRTPMSSHYNRVIPWDHKRKDFVYGAVQDACFKGFYDRRSLKSKIDLNRTYSSWDPVSTYNLVFLAVFGLIALALIVWIILIIIYWDHFKDNWGWWIFWLVLLIIFLLIIWYIFKLVSNNRTKKRFQRIDEACQDINNRNLCGTGTYVYPGENAAWLEVEMDPRRTVIGGPIRHDSMSYSLDNTPNLGKRIIKVPPRGVRGASTRIVEETTVVRGGNGNISEYSRAGRSEANSIRNSQNVMLHGSRPPSQMEEPSVNNSGYERLSNNQSVYQSNYSRGPKASYASSGNQSVGGASAKKMSFYEKLRKSKASGIGASGFESGFNSNFKSEASNMNSFANPVSGGGRSINGNSFVGGRGRSRSRSKSPRGFQSTGKPLNLMGKSPRR